MVPNSVHFLIDELECACWQYTILPYIAQEIDDKTDLVVPVLSGHLTWE